MDRGRLKTAARALFLVLAAAFLVIAVATTWDGFVQALADLTWDAVASAFLACLIALLVNSLSWRAVMAAVGLDATIFQAMRVFLLSQIGKYVPGSIWPVLAQAEFARDHGVSRARAMTGSIVAMIVGVITAGIVGALGIALSAPDALAEYWWVIVAAAGLACLLIPQLLARVVALAFRITRRQETPARIGGVHIAASAGWSILMWLILGLHAWVLLRQMAPETTFALAAGAFAFAWLVGFIVVFAPAGVGAREAALVLALSSVTDAATALSFAIISRFLMTAADAVGFGIGFAIGGRPRSRGDAIEVPRSGPS